MIGGPRAVKKGNYLGTEVDGSWWKRHRGKAFFARGNGELWMDDSGIHFRKLLTSQPLSIRWDEMTGARLGTWHAGRWIGGRPILKVDFVRDAQPLSAGFYLSADQVEMEQLSQDLASRIAKT